MGLVYLYTNLAWKSTIHVGKYFIHGSYGFLKNRWCPKIGVTTGKKKKRPLATVSCHENRGEEDFSKEKYITIHHHRPRGVFGHVYKKWWWKVECIVFSWTMVEYSACIYVYLYIYTHVHIPGSSQCGLFTKKTYQKAETLHIWKIQVYLIFSITISINICIRGTCGKVLFVDRGFHLRWFGKWLVYGMSLFLWDVTNPNTKRFSRTFMA